MPFRAYPFQLTLREKKGNKDFKGLVKLDETTIFDRNKTILWHAEEFSKKMETVFNGSPIQSVTLAWLKCSSLTLNELIAIILANVS